MNPSVIDEGTRMEHKLVSFPTCEKTKFENRLDRSVSALVEALCELAEVERMTGRTGLSQRVCLAVNDVTLDAMRLAQAKFTVGGTGRRAAQGYISQTMEEGPQKVAQRTRGKRE